MNDPPFRVALIFVDAKNENVDNKHQIYEIIKGHELFLLHDEEVLSASRPTSNSQLALKERILEWCDKDEIDAIFTFGGVGLSSADFVPEVTKSLIDREALGLSIALYKACLDTSPSLILSRGICGIRGTTLIINLQNDSNDLEGCLQVLTPCLNKLMNSVKGTDAWTEYGDDTDLGFRSRSERFEERSGLSSIEHDSSNEQIQHPNFLHMQVFEDEEYENKTSGDHFQNRVMSPQIDQSDLQGQNHSTEPQNTSSHSFIDIQQENLVEEKPLSSTHPESKHQATDYPAEGLKNFLESDPLSRSKPVDISSDIINLHNYNLPPESDLPLKNLRKRRSCLKSKMETKKMPKCSSSDIYNFDHQSDSEENDIQTQSSKNQKPKAFKMARIHHNSDQNKEVCFVSVGQEMTDFLQKHPFIQGIYLNKGKRQIKKKFVTLKRQESAVDKGSWERQGHKLERNRFDDYFEATDLGERRRDEIGNCQARDEYVVNWYVWCPGRGGNCQRKCGGYGDCIEGCGGMSHKQDRHNCSFLLNLKIFLSDLTKWRVQITGCHVPDSSITWQPPPVSKQLMDQSTKDFIISKCNMQNVSSTNIREAFIKEKSVAAPETFLSKRKISRVMYRLKKAKSRKCVNESSESSQGQIIHDPSLIPPIVPLSSSLSGLNNETATQEQITVVVPSNISQSVHCHPPTVLSEQHKFCELKPDEEAASSEGTSSTLEVPGLPQSTEIADNEMTNSDLRAVLLSLYNQQ